MIISILCVLALKLLMGYYRSFNLFACPLENVCVVYLLRIHVFKHTIIRFAYSNIQEVTTINRVVLISDLWKDTADNCCCQKLV